MDNYEKNIQNMTKIFSLINTLENKDKETQILLWIKEDIRKIIDIQNELKDLKLLKYGYKMKKITNIENLEDYIKKNNLLSIYNIVNNELENWRNINIKIKICYTQLN